MRCGWAVYLVYLGVQAIRKRNSFNLDKSADVPGITRRPYASGLVSNLLNPKMVVFTVALLPQFVRPELGSVWAQFAILSAILVGVAGRDQHRGVGAR